MFLRLNDRVRISGGFLLLTAWFGAVNGWQLLLELFGAALMHELGHLVVLRLLGAEVLGIRVNVLGAVMEVDCSRLSYSGELAAVLAGPGMNLLCAAILAAVNTGSFAAIGAHLVLGAFNLLPMLPLDGGRILYILTAWLFGQEWGAKVSAFVARAAAVLLAAGLVWVMTKTGGSLWLLPAAIGMLTASILLHF